MLGYDHQRSGGLGPAGSQTAAPGHALPALRRGPGEHGLGQTQAWHQRPLPRSGFVTLVSGGGSRGPQSGSGVFSFGPGTELTLHTSLYATQLPEKLVLHNPPFSD